MAMAGNDIRGAGALATKFGNKKPKPIKMTQPKPGGKLPPRP